MARKFEFTRTLDNTLATALIFDKNTAEAENRTYLVSGKYTADDRKLAKRIQKIVETDDDLKFIQIVDATTKSALYGTTLEQFMQVAVELDPKTRQPLA